MGPVESRDFQERLRRLLRLARFESWSVEAIEEEIYRLFRGEVTTQTPATPDQLPEPA